MTEQKKSAGYFDSIRNCPIYEGDVYWGEGEIMPFHEVVKTTDGFRVHHVGTTETFALSAEGQNLIKKHYIGNLNDNPDIINEFLAAKDEAAEEQTATKTTEPFSVDYDTSEVEEALNTLSESENEMEGENEPICSIDSDVTNAELQADVNESGTTENGTDNEDNAEESVDQSDSEEAEQSNVMIETAKCAVPEVIANTAEEKKALLRIQTIKRCISSNYDKIAELEETVDYHRNLASTLDYEPFVKLKDIVSEALHTNVDAENLKGLKDNTKNFESIINIQNLLKEHSKKADDAEYDISKLKNEIEDLEKEQAEIEEKIETFARQQRLFD